MLVTNIVDEDFVNYKLPSMYIGFPNCSFKCEKESGVKCCQNSELATCKRIEISIDKIIQRYLNNPITKAIVCCGLEPFENFDDLLELTKKLREKCLDPIVIYTGFYPHEIQHKIIELTKFDNIIIKFGRFIPNDKPKFNEELGVTLASSNQYVIEYFKGDYNEKV